jgi:hypothetical protein
MRTLHRPEDDFKPLSLDPVFEPDAEHEPYTCTLEIELYALDEGRAIESFLKIAEDVFDRPEVSAVAGDQPVRGELDDGT